LAVNLRYPTMGEASISQLQIWEHALPTLVTAAGWYANFPPEAVAFVQPAHEIEDIQAHLKAFLADPEHFARMGAHGRRILEERHNPEAYVDILMELASDAVEGRELAAWHKLLDRVHEEVNAWGSSFNIQRATFGWSPEVQVQHQTRESLRSIKGLGRRQIATVLAIEDAIAGQLTRVDQQQETTLSAICQAVAQQVGGQGNGNEAGTEQPFVWGNDRGK
jgi:hypothetical protein